MSRPTAEVAGCQPRRRLRHDIRLMSEQLDCHGHFVRHDRCQLAGYDAGRIRIPDCLLQAQCLCGYHFADRVCRSEAAAHPAEGAVCNARHGSERQPVPDHDLPALHISHGLPYSSAFWIFSVCYCTILCGNCQQRMPIVAGSPCHTDARPGLIFLRHRFMDPTIPRGHILPLLGRGQKEKVQGRVGRRQRR